MLKKGIALIVILLLVSVSVVPTVESISRIGPTLENHPPDKPIINGPTEGKVGEKYTFEFRATDPDSDNVSYYIKWEDGTSTGWTSYYRSGTPFVIEHICTKKGHLMLRCKAKDIHGAEGDWSVYYIPVSKNIINLPFLQFLIIQFPLFERLLEWWI